MLKIYRSHRSFSIREIEGMLFPESTDLWLLHFLFFYFTNFLPCCSCTTDHQILKWRRWLFNQCWYCRLITNACKNKLDRTLIYNLQTAETRLIINIETVAGRNLRVEICPKIHMYFLTEYTSQVMLKEKKDWPQMIFGV